MRAYALVKEMLQESKGGYRDAEESCPDCTFKTVPAALAYKKSKASEEPDPAKKVTEPQKVTKLEVSQEGSAALARAPAGDDDAADLSDDLITKAFDSPQPASIVIGRGCFASVIPDDSVASYSSGDELDDDESPTNIAFGEVVSPIASNAGIALHPP